MYIHYMTLWDETEVLFTPMEISSEGEHLKIYFEKPFDDGFKIAIFSVPGYECIKNSSFDEEEIKWLVNFAKDNISLIFKYAREAATNA